MEDSKRETGANGSHLTQCEPNLAHNELLFAVYAEGREFRMYTNGRTEGFQGPVGVSNRFPRLRSDLLQETQG